MGLFRKYRTRQVTTEPLPDWDDTRWRSHLRANAIGTDHHTSIYQDMIDADRKEAARHFKNEEDTRARTYAESALGNKRIVAALAALSPISNALYQRSEPLAGYTSLVQIPEPARSGIVTIIFAAGRLDLSYLTDTVTFLREQFGSVHVDSIQRSEGELFNLVNSLVRDALSPTPPDRAEVDAELASAVKEYFGLAVQASAVGTAPHSAPSGHSSDMGVPLSPRIGSPSLPNGSGSSAQLPHTTGSGSGAIGSSAGSGSGLGGAGGMHSDTVGSLPAPLRGMDDSHIEESSNAMPTRNGRDRPPVSLPPKAPLSPSGPVSSPSVTSAAPTPPYAGPSAPERPGGALKRGRTSPGHADPGMGTHGGLPPAVAPSSATAATGLAMGGASSAVSRGASASASAANFVPERARMGGAVGHGGLDDSDEVLVERYRHMRAVIAV